MPGMTSAPRKGRRDIEPANCLNKAGADCERWAATVMTPWGLVNCKVFGLQGPSLKNRVREIFTHGSVGGVGRKPGPYPAPNRRQRFPLGGLEEYGYHICAQSASPAAVGEAQC
jgi:hypothetical protein